MPGLGMLRVHSTPWLPRCARLLTRLLMMLPSSTTCRYLAVLQPYKRAKGLASEANTCLSLALRWLAGRPGEPRSRELDLGLCHQVAPQLRAVQAALAACCEGLAAAIEDAAPFAAALGSLRELDSRWAAPRALR